MTKQSNFYSRYYTYIKPVTSMPLVKNYGSTIFTLVTIIVFIFFAIKPTVETITVLQKKMENSKKVLDEITRKVNNLSLGKQNFDALDPAIKSKIQSAIPDDIALKELIQELEQSALENEASISALQIQPVSLEPKTGNAVGGLAEVSFVFNVEGQYQNLVSLLQDLKRSARLISLESITLNKLEEGSGLVMSLNGKAYFLK